MRSVVAGLSIAAALVAPLAAFAETTAKERADELVLTGRQHVEAKEVGRARDAFAEAYGLQATPETACELGAVEEELGEHLSAVQHLATCVADAASGSEPRKIGEAAFPKAKSHVGAISVLTHQAVAGEASPPTPLDGAVLAIDGAEQPRAARGAPIYVMPGTHQIRADAFGLRGTGTIVTVQGGEETTVNLTLEAPPPHRKRSRPSFAPAIVAFGLGAVGAGVGIGFMVRNGDLNDDAESLGRGRRCIDAEDPACADIADVQEDANDSGNIAVGMFSFAGAAAGTGAILLYWAIVRGAPTRREMDAMPLVGPMLSPTTGAVQGLVIGGRL